MIKKLIGYCAVDSGQLIAVDPCYLKDWKDGEFASINAEGEREEDSHYARACKQTLSKEGGGEVLVSGSAGVGVAFSTGWGDGNYPVYAHYGNGDNVGRIMKVTIEF